MTDLTKGIIEINGFTFCPGTKIDEVLAFFGDGVRVVELSTGPRVKFRGRHYIAENIYAYAFNFSKDTGVLQNFSLHPEVPSTVVDRGYGEVPKYKLAAAKKWLQGMIEGKPHTLNDSCVYYEFDNVDYYASVRKDLHYGLVGGEIIVTFHEA